MFARVTTTKGQASTEEANRVVRKALPRIQGIPGFRGGLWLLDEKGGKGLVITLYESKEALRASAEPADRVRKEATSELGVSVSSVEEGYEVVVAAGVAEPIQA